MLNSFLPNRLSHSRTTIVCLLILNIISLISLYSGLHQGGEFTAPALFYKQVVWIIVCWIAIFIFSLINYRFYFYLSYAMFAINIVMLLAVDLFGKIALGAQRWLTLGGFSIQPSELSKIVVIFLLARIFSLEYRNQFLRKFIFPLTLVMFTALLIFKQPDLGTGLILFMIFMIMGFASNVKRRYFIGFIVLGMLIFPVAWKHLKDYQKKRVVVFLNPNVDPLGAGYTIIQSKIAIGSGKIIGKGFLSGTQNQFNFLPERHTDFIFTIVAEEWGFFGSIFLLFIYWMILKTILDRTGQLQDPFAKLVCIGISSLFFIHVFINMGMTLGILPVVGIPLLFMSYGGTHLLTNAILIGVFLNICKSD